MGSAVLGEAISAIRDWSEKRGKEMGALNGKGAFGSLVFNDAAQQKRLPKNVYDALRRTITRGESLDPSIADAVASALKDWAIESGATHYTHWFQPLTGITAEKHDSFLAPVTDGRAVYEFSGKELVKGRAGCVELPVRRHALHVRSARLHGMGSNQPALAAEAAATRRRSSFRPRSSAGPAKRSTRRRRLLRSMEALSKQAVRVLKLFGSSADRVVTTCGPEQEYFLIDLNFYLSRPDLINAGRTLFGAKPPKGQELEDQYFGAIAERAMDFMSDVETELYKVGVPVKTRHNEVAPSQYEIAPIFENANLATDHQMMTMETMRRTAPKFGLACLLHEKPFAGVNGSGKHLNWSMSDSEGNNLLSPGKNTHDNVQFLVFCAAVLRAVNKWQGLLRASVASAGNDHRLGANEAPPAIISVFLGDMLTDIFEQIEKGGAKSTKHGGELDTGVMVLPKLPRDAGDRNRTSPFAFTGNKFEFRAVSSNQSIAYPNIALNVAVAESLDYMATELEKATKGGKSIEQAAADLLPKIIKENKRIIYNGNNYSKEWEKEAAKRGLLNLKNTVDALPQLTSKEVVGRVREVQGAQRARAARALRHHGRDLQQDRQRRRAVDGVDGEPLRGAGGARISEAGGAERRGREAGGREVGRRARSCSTG